MTTLQDIRRWARQAQPVFICGLERSGTSMLLVSLARHPALFPLKDVFETFVFLKPRAVLEDPPPYMVKDYLAGDANAAALRAFCQGLQTDGAPLSGADTIRAFFYFNAHQVYPGRRPLEKTPAHLKKVDRMLDIFPRARVIVCTRDPVSIIASYRKRLEKEKALGHGPDSWGWLDRTADQLVTYFQTLSGHMVSARELAPSQVYMAPYDWLTDTPEAALRALCEFAELGFAPEVLTPPPVHGRKIDVLLSQPITRRESDDDVYVDAATQQMIRHRMAPHMPLWNTPGLAPAKTA